MPAPIALTARGEAYCAAKDMECNGVEATLRAAAGLGPKAPGESPLAWRKNFTHAQLIMIDWKAHYAHLVECARLAAERAR